MATYTTDEEQTLGNFDDRVLAIYDGIFTKYHTTLTSEYNNDRITGDLYARAVINLMQGALTSSIEVAKQEVLLDEQEALLNEQVNKTIADKEFVDEQKQQLIDSVKFNNRIKALDSYGDMVGTMGAGGLVISTEMWATYFFMVRELYSTRKDFIDTWDASTNTPDISATTPATGDFYVVDVAGTTELDGIASWSVGDIVFFDGYAWRIDIASPSNTTITKPLI